ncbi:MAG: hypothetical protein KatS3mg080_0960 [Anoxybacillus sp.]|nr:MAG: hypothetical protein KatS3mg080_0960 [Anoxybacillus sp.]
MDIQLFVAFGAGVLVVYFPLLFAALPSLFIIYHGNVG